MKKKKEQDPVRIKYLQELLVELIALRTNFVDIISRYQSNQEARLLACIESLSTPAGQETEDFHHDEKQVVALLEELHELRIKPEKGRLKDVRRMDELIDRVYEQLVKLS
ncbi:MAG TPA: hypothetical protein PKI81_03560 [bacterium]|jgi:ribosomal protein L29|nr:hypothetical protein [bacterium]HOZ22986.1 hypothetical protein [bacterium]